MCQCALDNHDTGRELGPQACPSQTTDTTSVLSPADPPQPAASWMAHSFRLCLQALSAFAPLFPPAQSPPEQACQSGKAIPLPPGSPSTRQTPQLLFPVLSQVTFQNSSRQPPSRQGLDIWYECYQPSFSSAFLGGKAHPKLPTGRDKVSGSVFL